jgi:hypothetical protein
MGLILRLQSLSKRWLSILKDSIDFIIGEYNLQSKKLQSSDEKELTHLVYFKNRSYISKIFENTIPRKIIHDAKELLKYSL